jgi:hypothetical protein
MTPSRWIVLAAPSAALALGACRDLDRFDTGEDEAFCGTLVSASFAHQGFVPEGEQQELRLRLRFDIERLTSTPGVITTDDAARGLCAPAPLFDAAPLRAIKEAFHDPISGLKFGAGREANLLAWADSTCQGTMVGIVSLMKSGQIELRLLKPAPRPAADAGPSASPGFAQFQLTRRRGECGF